MRLRKPIVICLVIVLLLGEVSSPFLVSWAKSELAVKRFLDNPTTPLSESQEKCIYRYVECAFRRPIWYLPLGSGISRARQADLVNAAITRMAWNGRGFILERMMDAWYLGEAFPTLPSVLPTAVNDSIKKGDVGASSLLIVLLSCRANPNPMLLSLDIDLALSSEDNRVVGAICQESLEVLFEHRTACLRMLNNSAVVTGCKQILLERIADAQSGAKWFAGEEALLETLRLSGDDDMRKTLEKIQRQLREVHTG